MGDGDGCCDGFPVGGAVASTISVVDVVDA